MKAYIATVQILLPGEIESEAEACDAISACLSENLKYEGHILDWSYIPSDKTGHTGSGPYVGPLETLVPNPWDDDDDLTQYNPLLTNPLVTAMPAGARSFLDCSTAMVSKATADWLDARGRECAERINPDFNPPRWVATVPYGWFVYADEDLDADAFPADLIGVMRYARAIGCEYILFDRDAPTIDGLPSFDW